MSAQAQLMKAALAMPPDDVATLMKTLEQFIDASMEYQFGCNMIKLVEKLAGGGRLRDARTVAWKLLRPRPGAPTAGPAQKSPPRSMEVFTLRQWNEYWQRCAMNRHC